MVALVATGPQPASAAEPGSPADHPVVMYLAVGEGYSGGLSQAELEAQARSQFDTVSTYWTDQSRGRIDLRLEEVHWAPAPVSCGATGAAQNAREQAAQAEVGYETAPRRHFLYAVIAGCSFLGNGSAGQSLNDSGRNVYLEQGRVENGMWAHEFGHVFSFGHAGTLHCPQNAVDCDATSAGGNGVVVAYGDGTDTMGNSYATIIRGFSTPNAIRVGLLDSTQWVDVPADSTQQITIQSRDLLAGATAGTPLAVRVTDPVSGRTYYVELSSRDTYNQGQWWGGRPADNSVRGDATYQFDFGVRILRFAAPEGASYQNTYLLPAPVNADGVRRGVWDAGTTFVAPDGGVSIEIVSFAGTTATLNVTTRSDVIAPNAPAELASDGQVVTGVAEPGASVSITTADGALLGTATADAASGAFTATLTPAQLDGVVLDVTAEDAAGNVSDAAQVTVVVPAPTAPATPTELASDGFVVTGTADPGVTIVVSNADGTEIGTTTANPTTGSFSVTLAPAQPDGARLSVLARNAAGTQSVAAPVTVVRPANPAPTPPNGLASDGETVTGSAEPGTTVTAYDASGTTLGSAVADAETGAFTITLVPVQADGSVLTLVAENAGGDVSDESSVTVTATAPTAPTAPTNLASDGSTVRGQAQPGTTIEVRGADGALLGTGSTAEDGTFAIVIAPAQPIGTPLSVRAVDAAGVSSAVATIVVTADPVEPPVDPSEPPVGPSEPPAPTDPPSPPTPSAPGVQPGDGSGQLPITGAGLPVELLAGASLLAVLGMGLVLRRRRVSVE